MKKVAFVSASIAGIGKAIVKRLLQKGYIVYCNGRDSHKVDTFFKKIDSPNLKAIVGDISKEDEIHKALENIYTCEKRLDLVVANLGSGKSIGGWNVPSQEYRRIFDINFFAAVNLTTLAIPYLKKSEGNIIFISSIAGCERLGAPIAYTSAKTALLSYAKSLSVEVAKLNIRVNCISPGNVMFKGSTWDDKVNQNEEAVKQYIQENVALNKFIKPKDIAKTVCFLEENGGITGSNVVVDAGQVNKIV